MAEIDNVKAKRPKGLSALLVGAFMAGASISVIVMKAFSEETLPLKTFEWVLEHGIGGLLLVISFILGAIVLRQQGEIKELQDERHEERIQIDREYRDKVEALLREQIKVTQRTGALAAQVNEVLRSFTLVVDDDDDNDDDIGRGGAEEPKETS